MAGFALDDHAGDEGLQPADPLQRDLRFDQDEARAAGAEEIEAGIEPRGDLDLTAGHGQIGDHADRDAEVCHTRLPRAQTASIGKRNGDRFAAGQRQGLGSEERNRRTGGERFAVHPEIIESHRALDEGVEAGDVDLDPARTHGDGRSGDGPEARTGLEQFVFAGLDREVDVGLALRRKRLLAHAADFDPAVGDRRAAVERLGLLGDQADAEGCFRRGQNRARVESGEFVTRRSVALPRVDRVAGNERGETARPLQGKFGTLDPEIGRLHGEARGELFQTHGDDGLFEFRVEIDLGYRAGDHAAENQRRLPLLHTGRVGELDPYLRSERVAVVEIHPDRGAEGDEGEKPGQRNAPPLAHDPAVVLRDVLPVTHPFASRQIMRTS